MIRQCFNTDWHVERGDGKDSRLVGPITLPHDAMLYEIRDPHTVNGANTGYFPGGVYRYVKTFHAPEAWRGRSVTLEFEGVYMRSQVYLNGQLIAERPSGYAMFHAALDAWLNYGADNRIEVLVHNDQEPNSRWYTGSGIYRPVHLLVGDRIRVTPDGLRVSTRSIDGDDAVLEIATEVVNDEDLARTVRVAYVLTSPSGQLIGPLEEDVRARPGTTTVRRLARIPHARPWSTEAPHLYDATVTLTDGELVLDRAHTDFGIRTVAVDVRHGLRINGETVKLRGACVHHDNGIIGAHTLDAAEDRRVRLLKSSGFNAIRSAHNPMSRAMLRACDRHGMLVMDELTDVWRRPKGGHDYAEAFEQWWERDLASMIAKDFNHPSVIMYSIGNEIAETATAPGIELNRTIADRTRQLDSTRLVTNCVNGFLNLLARDRDPGTPEALFAAGDKPLNQNVIAVVNAAMSSVMKSMRYITRLPRVDKRTREAFAALDVAGYNYMSGRYRTDATRHPGRVIVGSETCPTETVAIWQEIEHMPHVIGDFTWTGWDYVGEAGIAVHRPNQRPRMMAPYPGLLAGAPVIDVTGHRQTQSYLNEIAWHLTPGPHLAVQPVNRAGDKRHFTAWRSTDSIASWSWPGCEGHVATVEAYADADRVELRLDGRTIDTQPAGAPHGYLAVFKVPYQPGELTAVAYGADGTEVGRDCLRTAGDELQLSVSSDEVEIVADGMDLAFLSVDLTDVDGVRHALRDREVTVEVSGAGTLLGFGSAEPTTVETFTSGRHSTYWGHALAVVRATHVAGDVMITATAAGCAPVTVTLVAIAARQVHQDLTPSESR